MVCADTLTMKDNKGILQKSLILVKTLIMRETLHCQGFLYKKMYFKYARNMDSHPE